MTVEKDAEKMETLERVRRIPTYEEIYIACIPLKMVPATSRRRGARFLSSSEIRKGVDVNFWSTRMGSDE